MVATAVAVTGVPAASRAWIAAQGALALVVAIFRAGGQHGLGAGGGAEDQNIAPSDVTAGSRPNTVVRLVPNATHCALQKAQEIIPWSLRWLAARLT